MRSLSQTTLTGGTLISGYNVYYSNMLPSNDIISETSPATGGGGASTYSYTWQDSVAGQNWASTYTSGPTFYPSWSFYQTTWFRRVVTSGTQTAYSTICKVTMVYPFIGAQIATTTASPISSGTIPAPFTIVTWPQNSPGSHNYTYTWQSSALDTVHWINIGTNSGFTPTTPLTQSTYYRLITTENGNNRFSNYIYLQIQGQASPIVGASFSTTQYNVQPHNSPFVITCSAPSGGNGTFTYTWASSLDGKNYTSFSSNQTNPLSYLVPSLSQTTYYELTIASGNATPVTIGPVTISVSSCVTLGTNLSSQNNYILTSQPRVAGVTNPSSGANPVCNVSQTVAYLDGLGRPLQTIQVKASPSYLDIIQPVAYDAFERESVKYLPYSDANANALPGSYRASALSGSNGAYNTSDQYSFYQKTGMNYSPISSPLAAAAYETSPLNRVVEQGAPGDVWQLTGTPTTSGQSSGHTTTVSYGTNSSLEPWNGGQSYVHYYTVSINSTTGLRSLVDQGVFYKTGTLIKTITRNENWSSAQSDTRLNTTEEYKDIEGHVLVKRTFNPLWGSTHVYSTYYVYDDFGNLSFVLPPAANADGGGNAQYQTILDNLCYQYNYDARQRLIEKKLPGKGWEFMIYNTLDQIAYSQDANQRNQTSQQWIYNKYDGLARPVIKGVWTSNNVSDANYSFPSRTGEQTLQSLAQKDTIYWVQRNYGNTQTGYTQTPDVGATSTILWVNYFDDYNVAGSPGYVPSTYSGFTNGLPTISKVAVLDSTPQVFLWSVNYYDDKGRPTNIYSQHFLNKKQSAQNYDHIVNQFDFLGQDTTTTRTHFTMANANNPAVTVVNKYVYDQIGRKIRTYEKINNDSTLLSQVDYNELGQAATKHFHSENQGATFLKSQNYTYNERGWLLKSSSPDNGWDFTLNLLYNAPDNGFTPQYNGNISELTYNSAYHPGSWMTFNLSYDNLNRLTSNITSNTIAANNHALDETITYDVNGNITGLNRTTIRPNSKLGTGFVYNYLAGGLSNQVSTITNWSSSVVRNYSYDLNGNTLTDTIGRSISYNLLNLPKSVSINGNSVANYVFAADGTKLRNSNKYSFTDYIKGIVYQNGALSFIQTEEGRAVPNGGRFAYEYDLKDHLGDVRITFQKGNSLTNPQLIQEDQYYAFGLRDTIYSFGSNNRYLYNGKEQQTDLRNFYDYGARFYDPLVARFTSVDPLAEQMRRHSPYNYGFDNPLRFIDKDGMGPTDVHINGPEQQKAFAELQKSVAGQLNLTIDANGKVDYTNVLGVTPDKNATQLTTAIDDHSVTVNVNTTSGKTTSQGQLFIGGSFGGNTVTPSDNEDPPQVTATQELNPTVLGASDAPYEKPGANTLHEVTEAYQGAKLSQDSGVSSGDPNAKGSVYPIAHIAATPQAGPIYERIYDASGRELQKTPSGGYPAGVQSADWYVNDKLNNNNKVIIQKLP